MAAKTKTVDGKPLTADQFAYVGDADDISTWHLPVDDDHIGSAVKMFGHETHVPDAEKKAVARKIASRAKAKGIDTAAFESKHLSSEHADFNGGWVEIFARGDYGPKGAFSSEDLDRVAASYDPDFHEAPACVGHPANDLPAYGWVDRLKSAGGKLLAKFREVNPAFESAVKAGSYKKRSAAFYVGDDGRISGLRHVGFLGAQPPEVKGLANIQFDDKGQKFIEVDFEEETVAPTADKSIGEQIKQFFIETFSGGAPRTFSEADAKRIATEAASAAAAPLQAKVAELETKLTTQATQFAERERRLAGGETETRAAVAVGRLKAAGKWVPAYEKMGVPLLFGELAKVTTTVEFGEGAAKKPTALLDLAVSFFEGLPAIVPGGRLVEGAHVPARTKNSSGDPLTDAAKARQKEKKITFGEALAQIVEEQPELTMAGTAAGGQV